MKFNEEQYQKSLPLIKTQLKALIARDLWDMNEYFRVMNTTNESVQKALEILNSEEYQKKLRLVQFPAAPYKRMAIYTVIFSTLFAYYTSDIHIQESHLC